MASRSFEGFSSKYRSKTQGGRWHDSWVFILPNPSYLTMLLSFPKEARPLERLPSPGWPSVT